MTRDITDQGWVLLRRSASPTARSFPFTSPASAALPTLTDALICRSQGEVGGTVASDWVTNLDRYGDPVLSWSRAHNLLASGPKGPRSTHRAICDILGMSAGECAGHAPTGRACQPAEPLMGRLRVTVENATSADSSHGPVCPHCREPLRSNLRQEQVTPQQTADPGPKLAMTLTYCGRCGWTLHLAPARAAARPVTAWRRAKRSPSPRMHRRSRASSSFGAAT